MKGMKKKSKRCMSDKIFDFCVYSFMIIFFLIVLYPLYYVVIVSFSKAPVGVYLWPSEFTTKGYEELFRYRDIWIGYANTIFYTVGHVIVSVSTTLTFAYAISRRYLVGNKFFTIYAMIPMWFGGGLIPTYLAVSSYGLVDTRAFIILAGCVSTYNIIVARTFFKSSIPEELYEASVLDGCGDGNYFVKVVIPLSKSIIAVQALFYGVGKWNSYTTELIYLRSDKKFPLQLILKEVLWSVQTITKRLSSGYYDELQYSEEQLRNVQEIADTAAVMQYCIIIASALPMLAIFPYVQKYFSKGVMLGSVKG